MHDTQSCARQHRHDRLGHHRHVNGYPVAGDQAEVGERVGGLTDIVFELGVGDRAGVPDRFALPVDGDAFTVAGFDVPVDAVVGDVEFSADEPLRDWGARPVQNIGEGGVPGQPVRLCGPECKSVLVGLAVEICSCIGVRGEVGGRRIRRRNICVRLGHGCERSHRMGHVLGYRVLGWV